MNSQTLSKSANSQSIKACNAKRHASTFEESIGFLDSFSPLSEGSHADVAAYDVYYQHVIAYMEDGSITSLKEPHDFTEAHWRLGGPEAIVLGKNSLNAVIELNHQGAPLGISLMIEPKATHQNIN